MRVQFGKIPPEHVKATRPDPLPARVVRGVDEARLVRQLLAESLRRLRAARALESSRKIVYPETTCIVRDCERLARRLNEMTAAKGKDEVSSVPVAEPIIEDGIPEFADDLEVG